jgi:hypothetical protein
MTPAGCPSVAVVALAGAVHAMVKVQVQPGDRSA